ncbi:MAG: hypothetical protein AAFQ45_06900 [Pseudomonadota bacterium]
MTLGLAASFAAPALAESADVRIAGTAIKLPDRNQMCVIDETTSSASQYFSSMAAAQSRMRNVLKVIFVPCAEKAIVEGKQAGVLSRWTMVFYNATAHKTPKPHAEFSTAFCNTLPGVLKDQGQAIQKRLDSIGDEILNRDMSVDFKSPFVLKGNCVIPIETKAAPIVYGAAATIATAGVWFVIANYTTNKERQPEIIKNLIAYLDQTRDANDATPSGGGNATGDAQSEAAQ